MRSPHFYLLAFGCLGVSCTSLPFMHGGTFMIQDMFLGAASEGGGVTLRAYKRGGRECSYDLRVAGSLARSASLPASGVVQSSCRMPPVSAESGLSEK